MPSSIRSTSIPPTPRGCAARTRILGAIGVALLAVWLAIAGGSASADVIGVRGADVRIDENEILLNADFDVALNQTLEEALQRGIPLYFVLEFEIVRPRWYWLDDKVIQYATSWRISWAPLTRHYRVTTGLLTLTFDTLPEVERLLSRVTSRAVGSADALTRGVRYDAQVRLRLDANQLPKPFQVNALASREWQLASDWWRWSFTP